MEPDLDECDSASALGLAGSGVKAVDPNPKRMPPSRPANAKAAAAAHKGQQFCKGCERWLPSVDFQLNQALCTEDKRILDTIYRMAVRQGKKEWWTIHRGDEQKTRAMLQDYKKAAKDFANGTKKTKWVLMGYIERCEASTKVEVNDHGEVMGEKRWIEFAQTAQGGKMSEDAAKLQWDVWAADPAATGMIYDYNGRGGALQFRIRVCVYIDFKNTLAQHKAVELHGESTKRPNLEQAQEQARLISKQHGKVGNGDFNLTDETQAMLLNAGNGGSFEGLSMLIPDVSALGAQPQDEQREETEANEEEDDNELECKSTIAALPAKRKWWDRERAVTDAFRRADALSQKMEAECLTVRSMLEAKQQELDQLPDDEKVSFASEAKILRTRLTMLQHLWKEPVELQSHLAAFTKGAASASTASSDSPGRPPSIGSAPPCANYDKLKTFKEFKDLCLKFHDCDSAAALAEHRKVMSNERAYVVELLVACKAVGNDIAKRKKQRESILKALADKKNTASIVVGPSSRVLAPIWEHGPTLASEVPVYDPSNLESSAKPARLSVASGLFDQKAVVTALKAFARVFDSSKEKVSDGRAQQRMVGAVVEDVRAFVDKAFPGLAWDATSPIIHALLQPCFYGIAPLVETVAVERESVACVRLNYKGARMLMLARSEELRSFMVQVMNTSETVTLPVMFRFMKHMSRDNLEAYTSSGRLLWHSTIGPNEAIYIPAAMIFAESVYKDTCIGVRIGVMAPSDVQGVCDLESIATEARARGKPTGVCDEVTAYLKARAPAPPAPAAREAGGLEMPCAPAQGAP